MSNLREKELLSALAKICRRHLQISASRTLLFKDAYDDFVWVTMESEEFMLCYYLSVDPFKIRVGVHREDRTYLDLFQENNGVVAKGQHFDRTLCEILLKTLNQRLVLDALAQVEGA